MLYPHILKHQPHVGLRACRASKKFTLLTTEQHDVLLLDNDEPVTYMEAMMGPNHEKCLGALESKIESMHNNQVWNLDDPINGVRHINCKWFFKKKIDMYGNVHI
jgi:hypothetical protein